MSLNNISFEVQPILNKVVPLLPIIQTNFEKISFKKSDYLRNFSSKERQHIFDN